MKTCTKCKAEKPFSDFGNLARMLDGLQGHCRECKRLTDNARPEEIAARKRSRYEANLEKIAEHRRSYVPLTHNALKAYWRAYYADNVERYAANHRAYRYANPEKIAEIARNNRAIRRKAEGKHTAADIRAIFDRQGGLCASCQEILFESGKQKYHVDRIMPIALGGSSWPANLQCLCPFCSLSKGAKHPDD
jgi:5-methylcytosine-specific restriction endonuclease McrA